MLFGRTSIPLPLNHSFAICQKSDFNRSKSHLNSPFMEFFPSHKTTLFVATNAGDQLNFIATQLTSSDSFPSPTWAINYDWYLRYRRIWPKFPGASSIGEMSGKNRTNHIAYLPNLGSKFLLPTGPCDRLH